MWESSPQFVKDIANAVPEPVKKVTKFIGSRVEDEVQSNMMDFIFGAFKFSGGGGG